MVAAPKVCRRGNYWGAMMPEFPCRRIGLALTILLSFAGTAYAGDISTLVSDLQADFSNPVIPGTEALIIQGGNSEMATIDQQGATAGAGNYSEINQDGSSNQASVIQDGSSNRSRIDQTGASNLADVTQTGTGNFVDLVQTGDANLTASQTGDYNSIVANMTNQNGIPAILSESGNNNSITANLSSPGLNVNVSIVGDGMSVTTAQ